MLRRGTKEYTLWTIGLAVVAVFALFPVLWIISLSFKDPGSISDRRLLPADWTFDNYSTLFEGGFDSPFLLPLINSIVIALIATVIAIVLASFTAYAIARLDFPGKLAILGGALALAIFPPISVVGPLFDIWRVTGLYDTWLGLILPTSPSPCRWRSGPSRRSSARSRSTSNRPRKWTGRRPTRPSAR